MMKAGRLAMEDPFRAERQRMVEEQILARGVQAPEVLRAMREVPRHAFLPPRQWAEAHADGPVPLAPGATISQPYIVAFMLEGLGPIRGKRVLEVGSGCGYVLALLDALGAEACGIELDEVLAARSREVLASLGAKAFVHTGDGAEGWPGGGPFDGLLLSCATPSLPGPLLDQLATGAVVLYPEGRPYGPQILVRRCGAQREDLLPVAFVGLR